MKIGHKDWIFIGIVATVLLIFYLLTGEEKTKRVPMNEKHAPFYQMMKEGKSKMEIDKNCPTCHNESGGVPFPPGHPVKPKDGPMRCLFCHKLDKKGM